VDPCTKNSTEGACSSCNPQYIARAFPQPIRQLYLSTVASKLDFTAPVWFQLQDSVIYKIVNSVQRMGARAITGAFKIVPTPILDIEAGLLLTIYRLQQQMMQHLINLHTLEKKHLW
jgi:hypothetical protein